MEPPEPLSQLMAAEPDRPTTTGPMQSYTVAQCVSSVGSWMQTTAMGWLAWDLTHSVRWVGAMALMDLVALLWVAPLAGTVTDRRSPYRLFMVTQLLMLVDAALMCGLAYTGHLSIGLLMVFALIEATLNGFNNPVRMTSVNLLSTPGAMSKAVAMNSLGMSLARSIGPAAAGWLLAEGGASVVFAVNAVSFLAMIFVLWQLRGYLHRPPAAEARPFLEDVTGGFAYVLRTPAIALLIALATVFAVLARPVFQLLPAFAGGVFHGGPQTLGWLLAAQSVGAMAGAVFMIRRHSGRPLAPLMWTTGVGLCLFMIGFSATRDLRIALPFMVLAGLCHVLCNISLQSWLQQGTDPAFRGRVLSIFSLIFRSGPSAGAFVIGMAAPWLGLRTLVGSAAALACLLMIVLSRRPEARAR